VDVRLEEDVVTDLLRVVSVAIYGKDGATSIPSGALPHPSMRGLPCRFTLVFVLHSGHDAAPPLCYNISQTVVVLEPGW
jgi:hypothetical protein